MKLSFIVLVFFLSVVAGSRPSPDKPAGHAAQKHNVGHSSGGTRTPNKRQPISGKLGNANSSKDGRRGQQQKNAVQRTPPAPKLDLSSGKSGKSSSGKDGKTHQQQTVIQPAPTRSPNLIAAAGKSKTLSKSGRTPSSEVGKIQQKKKTGQYRLTSTLKPYTIEKSDNVKSANDGQISQQQNVSQHTSTLKPPSVEKSGNTTRLQVGETPQQRNNPSPKIEISHHYYFSPPQQISYRSTFYPVYQGRPPVYVYEYRDSGSRFDNLLTGLALYNLGRNSHFHKYGPDRRYSSAPGEVCKLRISKGPVGYEETRIDCNLMSSFIWDETPNTTRNEQHVVKNTTQVTVTRTLHRTGNSSVSTATTTSNTVEDALKVKGPSIQVTPGMTCYMIRTSRDTITTRRSVDCGLLQEYARSSFHRSVAQCLSPHMMIIFNFLFIIYWLKDI